jgi:ribosomal protein S18 acetylase RimI-like enzyme
VTLLRRAVELTRSQGAGLVTLTVDTANAPARRLYAAFEFHEWSRREVWIKVLNRT